LIRPTLQALLPSLTATPEELVAANAATSTVESVGTLIGPLVAGLLVGQVSVGAAFSVAAAVLAVGVYLILRVRAEGQATGRAASARRPAFAWRTVGQHPGATVVVILMVAQAFVRGCLNVLIVVAAFELLDGGGEAFDTAQLVFRGDVLPMEQEAQEIRRAHRLDLRAQPVQRIAMDARKEPSVAPLQFRIRGRSPI
jgi:MFS family permease